MADVGLDAVTRFLHRKALRRIRRRLRSGEQVRAVTPGRHDGQEGVLAVTQHRTFWIPRRRFGRIEERRTSRLHEVRQGGTTRLMDSRAPTWQVQAPASNARTVAQATRPPVRSDDGARRVRVERLQAEGMISDDEARWMLKDR